MRFLDLNKLKIVKEFNYSNVDIVVEVDNLNAPIGQIKEACYVALLDKFIDTNMETNFNVKVAVKESADTTDEIEEEFFTTFVNVFSAIFFTNFCKSGGRPRERRLDVPEKLKISTRASLNLLKRAINSATYSNIFNLHIEWKDWNYDLIDQSYEGDDDNTIHREFVNEVDVVADDN